MTAGRPDERLVDAIDAVLPQTQCRRCGYDACRPYAEALAAGTTDINRCPPGGDATIGILSRLLRRSVRPLDGECGEHAPRSVALIDEQWCIGCTLCIRACPVDAIVGARRLMHTVLEAECSGCELCVAPCPVDCISMVPATSSQATAGAAAAWFQPWTEEQAQRARERYRARQARLAQRREATAARRRAARDDRLDTETRRAEVLEAVRRVRARRGPGAAGGQR